MTDELDAATIGFANRYRVNAPPTLHSGGVSKRWLTVRWTMTTYARRSRALRKRFYAEDPDNLGKIELARTVPKPR